MIAFWTTNPFEATDKHLRFLYTIYPDLNRDISFWGPTLSDTSASSSKAFGTPKLKRLARMFVDKRFFPRDDSNLRNLINTLLVDHEPLHNILNYPYSAVHPLPFTFSRSDFSFSDGRSYLVRVLVPWRIGDCIWNYNFL